MQRIKERPKIWIDFFMQCSREKSEPLPCFNSRAGQDDSINLFCLQSLNSFCHCEVCLSGTCRANPKSHCVFIDCINIFLLIRSLRTDCLSSITENVKRQNLSWRLISIAQDHCNRSANSIITERLSRTHNSKKILHQFFDSLRAISGAAQNNFIAADRNRNVFKSIFDCANIGVIRTRERNARDI